MIANQEVKDRFEAISQARAEIEKLERQLAKMTADRNNQQTRAIRAEAQVHVFEAQLTHPQKEVTTLVQKLYRPEDRAISNAELADHINQGWEKFDCAFNLDGEQVIRLVRIAPIPTAPLPTVSQVETPARNFGRDISPEIKAERATLSAMMNDLAISHDDFVLVVNSSRVNADDKKAYIAQSKLMRSSPPGDDLNIRSRRLRSSFADSRLPRNYVPTYLAVDAMREEAARAVHESPTVDDPALESNPDALPLTRKTVSAIVIADAEPAAPPSALSTKSVSAREAAFLADLHTTLQAKFEEIKRTNPFYGYQPRSFREIMEASTQP